MKTKVTAAIRIEAADTLVSGIKYTFSKLTISLNREYIINGKVHIFLHYFLFTLQCECAN